MRGGREEAGGVKEKKKRTQLTNMGKIPANEDGRSSGEPAGWGGIMTLTLHQGSNWRGLGEVAVVVTGDTLWQRTCEGETLQTTEGPFTAVFGVCDREHS